MNPASPHTSNRSYIPEIDGLRAVAVLAILFFHLQVPYFQGGYVGVDIFFVISGFLITRIIKRDVEAGTFSFREFYLRRARRLLPALYVTLAATFLVSTLMFSPDHLKRVGSALISALFWTSNFFFWSETGYFDAEGVVKPLLHTWSLGVEEQFYLVWPLATVTFLASSRLRRWLPGFLVLVAIGSVWWAEVMFATDPAAAFFFPVGRLFEFGIGALLVWLIEFQPRRAIWLEPLLLVAFFGIAYSVFFFNRWTEIPGVAALVPTLCAALAIYAGRAKYLGSLLRNRIAVWIGLISYSLYLVHWPIVVFMTYRTFVFGGRMKLLICCLSLLLAWLLYTFVETPFRRPRPEKKLAPGRYTAAVLALAGLLSIPAATARLQDGWLWRWDLPETVLASVSDRYEKREETWRFVFDRTINDLDSFGTVQPDGQLKVLVLGDSHAKDLFNALYLNKPLFGDPALRHVTLNDRCFYLLAAAPPPPEVMRSEQQVCEETMTAFQRSALVKTANVIIYSSRWKPYGLMHLDALISYLDDASNAELALVGRTAEFIDVPKLVFNTGTLDGLEEELAKHRLTTVDQINARLRQFASQNGLQYLDRVALVCRADGSSCDAVDDDGHVLYFDYGHWTLEGARYFGRKALRTGLFSGLLQSNAPTESPPPAGP